MNDTPIIIIGSGLAGYMLAKAFRKLDDKTPLLIITKDKGRFYSKPLLSTALAYQRDIAALTTASAETMSQQLNAQIMVNASVTDINPQQNSISVNGKTILYRQLVLACGADIIHPPIKGDAISEIYAVNNLQDYAKLREALAGTKRLTIMGAGLVGCEFANDFINSGMAVDVVALSARPLDSFLPRQFGELLQHALADLGVNWHLQKSVVAIDKHHEGYQLTLDDQQTLTTSLVLSAIGIKPHIALAKHAGIATRRGILVNERLQTNIDNIYALGDCAEVNGQVRQFVAPLLLCAKALASTLAGQPQSVDFAPQPIVVKTSACPLVVYPPATGVQGRWDITGQGCDLSGLFYDTQRQLCGFVLAGKNVKEKRRLLQQIAAAA